MRTECRSGRRRVGASSSLDGSGERAPGRVALADLFYIVYNPVNSIGFNPLLDDSIRTLFHRALSRKICTWLRLKELPADGNGRLGDPALPISLLPGGGFVEEPATISSREFLQGASIALTEKAGTCR
jgi:hypothetical protein